METHTQGSNSREPSPHIDRGPEGESKGIGYQSPTAVEEQCPVRINVHYHYQQWTQAAASPQPGREVVGGINTHKLLSSLPSHCTFHPLNLIGSQRTRELAVAVHGSQAPRSQSRVGMCGESIRVANGHI